MSKPPPTPAELEAQRLRKAAIAALRATHSNRNPGAKIENVRTILREALK